MKTKILSLVALLLIGVGSVYAKDKTEKFLVNGKCEMCEKRIEMAALSVEGVSKADWNKETKEINVTLDDSKTDVHKVHMAIAKVGHDTEMHKAKDETYEKLPSCCKYDRTSLKAMKMPMKHEHK
ncbi:MAG TPA: heavy-metal-associated domain-containing protein [Draconibacterium sp.]|nr:heavy-metal-associated domain-containing protein [Draconibacterium sp.]